jgi:hypothetical protein
MAEDAIMLLYAIDPYGALSITDVFKFWSKMPMLYLSLTTKVSDFSVALLLL